MGLVSDPTDCMARRLWDGSITIVVALGAEDLDELLVDSLHVRTGATRSSSCVSSWVVSGFDDGTPVAEKDVDVDRGLDDRDSGHLFGL